MELTCAENFVKAKAEDVKGIGKGSKGIGTKSAADEIIRDGSHINKSGELKPNIKYQAGEYEYLYETDNMGRLKEFNAED